MNCNVNFSLDAGKLNIIYFKLLSEEDFDFKTKDINFKISNSSSGVGVSIIANSVLDLKIGTTALIKSLEVIEKTLKI